MLYIYSKFVQFFVLCEPPQSLPFSTRPGMRQRPDQRPIIGDVDVQDAGYSRR